MCATHQKLHDGDGFLKEWEKKRTYCVYAKDVAGIFQHRVVGVINVSSWFMDTVDA